MTKECFKQKMNEEYLKMNAYDIELDEIKNETQLMGWFMMEENVERAFNNFDNFQIKQMIHDEKSMKIFRFEVVKDMTVRSGNSIKIENVKIGVN